MLDHLQRNGIDRSLAFPTPTTSTTHSDADTHTGNGQEPSLYQLCARTNARVTSFLEEDPATDRLRDVQEQTRISLAVLEEALSRYSVPELSISYNGGKDCLVLLVLFLAALARHADKQSSSDPSVLPPALQSVYIISPHPFPEVDSFVASSISEYALNLARYSLPMKLAFSTYLREKPEVKAILVGTRRTDPHGGKLGFFDPTDHGWPEFMRCHPVIDWHYAEIWAFIRHLEVPYCPLYDQGYTSLGGTTDTHPNPALLDRTYTALTAGKEEAHFRPAYELLEDEEERLGRDRATPRGMRTPMGANTPQRVQTPREER